MTDKSYACAFCGADSGRLLLRLPRASICDKCVVGAVEDIRKDANSEYVRGLIYGHGRGSSVAVLESIRKAVSQAPPTHHAGTDATAELRDIAENMERLRVSTEELRAAFGAPKSARGVPLILTGELRSALDDNEQGRPVLTAECSDKWYELYLLRAGEVETVAFSQLEGETYSVVSRDHAPNPEAIAVFAGAMGYYIDPLFMELAEARWRAC